MNDIEKILLDQPLRPPARRLDRRVFHTLRRSVCQRPWRLNLFVGALGSAAAASVACAVIFNTPTEAPAASPFEITEQVTEVAPEALIAHADAPPTMTVRYQHVRRTRWVDPVNNVRIEVTVPRQQVVSYSLPVD